jgi:hypothetical protein
MALENITTVTGRAVNVPGNDIDTDRIIPAVPYATVSYSAGGANSQGIHGCFPGKAGQTREQWLDVISRAMIRQAAAWMRDVSVEQGIPLRRLTVAQVAAGERGYCDHYDVSRAFRKSTHTDVGPAFPWDVLAADITALVIPSPIIPPITQTEDDDMQTAIAAIYQPIPALIGAGRNKSFALLPNGDVRHAAGPDVAYAARMGLPVETIAGDEHYNQCIELDAVYRAKRS